MSVDGNLVVDSGCSQSILMNKNLLSNYQNFNLKMSSADNGTLQCIGIGDLVINQHLRLRDVLHCPILSMNLLLKAQLYDKGFSKQQLKNESHILRDRKFILKARRSGGLGLVPSHWIVMH